ncbi:MAG: protoheme IX farnesyltransferase [Candidatus Desulfobacillus denitrificans]|nr:protoheme IX farnesyltransferase [Zoogloeaceae bacterium]
MTSPTLEQSSPLPRWRQYLELAKPRVNTLIVFCAVIGMFLAAPGMVPLQILLAGTLGIALAAGGAAVINCVYERTIDAVMARTSGRPLPRGEVSTLQALVFGCSIGAIGLSMLYYWVNALTMWLTLGTFVGYAVIYTMILKPLTSQNIVIGGASGAMPPILGWAAVTGEVTLDAVLLFLIIFFWTPPHFWSLALYRRGDYAKSGLPMLPVTHGEKTTRLQILLYTVLLVAVTLMPFFTGMSGWPYLVGAVALGGAFLAYAFRLWREYSDALAQRTFRFSIVYLTSLFGALLVDHYLKF